MPLDDKPFYDGSLYAARPDLCYLSLLCTLAQDPIWRGDLNGHISKCLAIADKPTSWKRDFNLCAVYIPRIFAVFDVLGKRDSRAELAFYC